MENTISFRENFIPLILSGVKTQTRRLMKKQPLRVYHNLPFQASFIYIEGEKSIIRTDKTSDGRQILKPLKHQKYKVGDVVKVEIHGIRLKIEEIRCEKVGDISESDAVAEGFVSDWDNAGFSAVNSFAETWDDIYGEDSFDSSPYCWVIIFSRC